ncbi:13217_t:CDS:1, partial [Cetraspora pellucida]
HSNLEPLLKAQCKKLLKINNKLATNLDLIELKLVVENLHTQLQDETTSLAEKWQIRSNTKWVKEDKKLIRYFFA